MRAKKENVQKHTGITTKMEVFLKNKTERKDKHAKTCHFCFRKKKTRRGKKRPEVRKFPHTCFKGGHRQRKRKKEKENTCGKTEKNKKRKKRQQMNKWMNKLVT